MNENDNPGLTYNAVRNAGVRNTSSEFGVSLESQIKVFFSIGIGKHQQDIYLRA